MWVVASRWPSVICKNTFRLKIVAGQASFRRQWPTANGILQETIDNLLVGIWDQWRLEAGAATWMGRFFIFKMKLFEELKAPQDVSSGEIKMLTLLFIWLFYLKYMDFGDWELKIRRSNGFLPPHERYTKSWKLIKILYNSRWTRKKTAGWSCSLVVEYTPRMFKSVGSIPNRGKS